MSQDDIFSAALDRPSDFQFDEKVASVFDDMVHRSVPFYDDIQDLVVQLTAPYLVSAAKIYDIGCSTGTTLCRLLAQSDANSEFALIGIEPSTAMAGKARDKLATIPGSRKTSIKEGRIEEMAELPDASVVIMLFTLQFVRPLWRQRVLEMIFASLRPGGCLLLGEKILSDSSLLSRVYIDIYHRRKAQAGYSDQEITRKREALENVGSPDFPLK